MLLVYVWTLAGNGLLYRVVVVVFPSRFYLLGTIRSGLNGAWWRVWMKLGLAGDGWWSEDFFKCSVVRSLVMDSWSLFQLLLGQSLCKTKVQVLKTWDYAVFILVMSCSCFYPENSKKKKQILYINRTIWSSGWLLFYEGFVKWN